MNIQAKILWGQGEGRRGGGDAPPPGEGDSPIEREVRTALN